MLLFVRVQASLARLPFSRQIPSFTHECFARYILTHSDQRHTPLSLSVTVIDSSTSDGGIIKRPQTASDFFPAHYNSPIQRATHKEHCTCDINNNNRFTDCCPNTIDFLIIIFWTLMMFSIMILFIFGGGVGGYNSSIGPFLCSHQVNFPMESFNVISLLTYWLQLNSLIVVIGWFNFFHVFFLFKLTNSLHETDLL